MLTTIKSKKTAGKVGEIVGEPELDNITQTFGPDQSGFESKFTKKIFFNFFMCTFGTFSLSWVWKLNMFCKVTLIIYSHKAKAVIIWEAKELTIYTSEVMTVSESEQTTVME